jgi:hypothetical protein
MLLPSLLAVKPTVQSLVMCDYDFQGQNRWDSTLHMSTTSGTLQTFNSSGKPSDSKSDPND